VIQISGALPQADDKSSEEIVAKNLLVSNEMAEKFKTEGHVLS
jgi:hypothetical protein